MSGTLELPCLGRPFQLGMLYDCRNDSLVPGKTLWNEELLKDALSETPQPSSEFEIIAEDTTTDKMSSLGVEGNLSLSILGGLISVNGSAKYVEDHKSSSNHARVTLKYASTSKFQQLTMKQLATSNIQYPEVFDEGTATHVVTGVLFGADAFFIFDREVSQEENYRKVHGDMQVSIKSIPNLQIGGGVGVDIEMKNKQETDKFHCKFYGDLILDSNPSTFQDAVAIYKKLPEYFRNKTVPKKVWLYPLSSLSNKAAQMVREIKVSLVTQAQQITDVFHNMLMKSTDLIKSDVCESFPVIKEQLSLFKEMITEYKTNFMKQLSLILPKIRGGELAEQELADIIMTVYRSPFNERSLKSWLDAKEEEIKVLSMYLDIMHEAKGVIIAAPGDFASIVLDPKYEYVLSFEFKVGKKNDEFLQGMNSVLRNDVSQSTRDGFPKQLQWFKNVTITSDLRLKATQFITFAKANSENKRVKFIASDKSEDDVVANNKGADIILYQNGIPSVFEPPSQLEKLTATNVTHESIHLKWSPPQYGVTSIKCYTILYRPTDASEDWGWKTQKTKQKETAITIDQLASETKYSFKVCAECECGLSGDSELTEIKTLRSVNVLLIGKIGSGKSTLGNLLIKDKKFKEKSGFSTTTDDSQVGSCIVSVDDDNFTMHIIDTPGLADVVRENKEIFVKIAKTIPVPIQNGKPIIHTMIYVLSAAHPYTRDDAAILDYFAKAADKIWSYAMLVITNANNYGQTKYEQEQTFRQLLKSSKCPDALKNLFDKIENRFVFVESKSSNPQEIQETRLEILKTIQQLSSGNDGGYIAEFLFDAKNLGKN